MFVPHPSWEEIAGDEQPLANSSPPVGWVAISHLRSDAVLVE